MGGRAASAGRPPACRLRGWWYTEGFRFLCGYGFLSETGDGFDVPARLGCMIRVKVRGNESVEQMVRRFKKLCEKEGLTRDIKRTSYYEKPSERRRRKTRKSMKRIAKESLLF